MLVKRRSIFSGKISEMDLPVTEEQLAEFKSNGPRMIQDIFPNLTNSQREFIKTGVTQEEWDATFGV